jgi:hypothetical protein
VRYLPSFCGTWEIELYPDWKNLVVLPVPIRNTTNPLVDTTFVPVPDHQTQSFTQIGKPFSIMNKITATGVPALIDDQIVKCGTGRLTQCLMNQTTFKLRFEVFEGLRQMYSQQPLIIPTNILQYGRFSGEPGKNDNGTTFHATLSQCLENCDSIFILVPFDNLQTTCFYQPYLRDLRVSLGEFGTRPQRYVQTWDDPRFLAMVLDALNLETSEITAMNEDVARSLNAQKPHWSLEHAKEVLEHADTYMKGDKSNFLIGLSLSQVGFQSGTVSSPNTNVPFIFDAVLDRSNPLKDDTVEKIDTSIVIMFLLDAAIMIQVVPESDVPIVKLTTKSIV